MPGSTAPGLTSLARVSSRDDFTQQLRRLQRSAGLSVRAMSRTTGPPDGKRIPHTTLGDYVSGRHLPPNLAVLRKLIGACGVIEKELVTAWEEAWERARVAPGPQPAPYRGLEFFRREDATWFFGREDLTKLAAQRAEECRSAGRPLLIVGASGAGKSSLLRAGLLPALTRTAADAVVITPGPEPLTVLRRCLEGRPGVVVVDQFEEIFAPAATGTDRHDFIDAIRAAAADGVLMILGLRADFYAQALGYRTLAEALQDTQIVVRPMTEPELRQAITEPAKLAKVTVDDALVDLVLSDLRPVAGSAAAEPAAAIEAGTLPLLSYALLAAWPGRRSGRLMIGSYLAAGGIRGAVRNAAEAAYQTLDPSGQRAARRLFLRLVWVAQDAPDTRRRAQLTELLAGQHTGEDATRAALDAFVRHRLLTASGGPAPDSTAPDSTVEISHEVLLKEWPRLRDWIDASRADLLIQRRVTEEAHYWEQHGRQPGDLLRGGKLAMARSLASDPARRADLAAAERDLLDASIAAEDARHLAEHRTALRLRRLACGLTAALVLAAGLTAYAFVQRTDANTQRNLATVQRDLATSRQIATETERIRGQDPGLAAQLSVAAYRTAQTPQARGALLETSGLLYPQRLTGVAGTVQAIALSPDRRLLAAVGNDGELWLWHCSSAGQPTGPGTRIARFGAPLYAVAFSPHGEMLATAGTDGTVHMFSLADPGHPLTAGTLTGPRDTLYSLAYTPDGETLAGGSADGNVWLWNLTTPRPDALSLPAGGGYVQAVTFSSGGRLLAAGTSEGAVRIWHIGGRDRSSPRPLGRPLTASADPVLAVAFTSDGRTLAVGSHDTHVYLWNIKNTARPSLMATLTGATSWVNAIAFSPDGGMLAAGGSDDTVRLWNVGSRTVTATLAHPGPVTSLLWNGGGTLITGAADGALRVWRLPSPVLNVATSVNGLAFSPHGQLLAVASNALQLWNPAAREQLGTAPAVTGATPETVAFSPRERVLATGFSDGTVRLYQYAGAGALTPGPAVLRGSDTGGTGSSYVESLAYSPDGRLLASGGDDGTLRLWDVSAAPRQLMVVHVTGAPVFSVAFSPDGHYVATGDAGGQVRIWSLGHGGRPVPIARLTGPAGIVYSVAFSPDGRRLAAGSSDRSVYLWDTSVIQRPRREDPALTGPASYVYSIAFSPDGRFLAVGSTDDTVWLWHVTGQPSLSATLTGPASYVYAVGFSPDGRTLAAGSADGTVRLWDTSPTAAAAAVCATAGDPVTAQEWNRYVPGAPYSPPCGR
jgi:WD40 repeat protein